MAPRCARAQSRRGEAAAIDCSQTVRVIGQARDGGDDITTGRFRWEVKRRKGIAVHEWVEQAVRASGPSDIPVVACRGDGKGWLVVMRLEDALPLIRGELPQR